MKIDDKIIRISLRNSLQQTLKQGSVVIEEFNLMGGTARIDVLVIDTYLHGFELKSDQDNLDRLPHQAHVYNGALDYISIVVTEGWASKAIELVPGWWGIQLALPSTSGEIKLHHLRLPLRNPIVDIRIAVDLLAREEALFLLDEISAASKFWNATKAKICAQLVERSEPDWLRFKINQQLKHRQSPQVASL
jgi:hypothetical protein